MDKEIVVEISLEFLAQLETMPPARQAAAREMVANLRQAVDGVNAGRYPNINDAIEAITGRRMERVD